MRQFLNRLASCGLALILVAALAPDAHGFAVPAQASPTVGLPLVAGGPTVTQISAGGRHTCARLDDGTAACWGENEYGALGDGTTTDRSLPAAVHNPGNTGPLTGVTAISAGGWHTCARLDDGTAACWGYNGNGALGDGTTTDRSLPAAVHNPGNTGPLTGVTAIEAGMYYACARLDEGTAACWGRNNYGQLGDGTTTDRSLPAAVRNPANTGSLTGVSAVSAGSDHTCARLDDGTAACWGYNGWSELGDGTTTDRSLPAPVRNPGNTGPLTGVTAVSAGSDPTCARLDDGTAACWGYNGYGALGDGTTTQRSLPAPVRNPGNTGPLTGVTAVSAGGNHACARLDDGTAACWGWNAYGQLGDSTTTMRFLPAPVRNPGNTGVLAGVTAISKIYSYTCARLDDGNAACWGWNEYGQLGDGTTTNRLTPVPVVGLGGSGPGLSVSPAIGPWSGGNTVTIAGTGLTDATARIGGQSATVLPSSTDTALQVSVPPLGHPEVQGTTVDVEVTPSGGSPVLAGTYTYRGVVVFLLRGLNSKLPDVSSEDTFRQPNGLAWRLEHLPGSAAWPGAVFADYGYDDGGAGWNGPAWEAAYSKVASFRAFFDGTAGSVPALDAQIKAYVAKRSDVDVYLVGHSQGGVVATAYLAYLQSNGRDPAVITSGGGTGRLAGVVTLDSPIGGLAVRDAENMCAALVGITGGPLAAACYLASVASNLRQFDQIWATGGNVPYGANRSIQRALLRPAAGRNQAVGEWAVSHGVRVLTVGNRSDMVVGAGSLTGVSTQWMENANGVATDVVDLVAGAGLSSHIVAAGPSHGFVLTNGQVCNTVLGILAPSLQTPCTNFQPATSKVAGRDRAAPLAAADAPTVAVSGTVTGIGGAPIDGAWAIAIGIGGGNSAAVQADAGGAFVLELPEGSYKLGFVDPSGDHADGYWSATGYTQMPLEAGLVVVATDPVAGLDVTLPGARHISGTLRDHDGHPVPDVAVIAKGGDGQLLATTASADDGTWTLTLDVGTYVLEYVDPTGVLGAGYVGPDGFVQDLAAGAPFAVGIDDVSDVDLVIGLPSAPADVTATPGNGTALIKWLAPASAGGSPITGYTATSAPGGKTCATSGTLSCTVTGLVNGTAYTVTVTASNTVGTGPASSPPIGVTPTATLTPFTDIASSMFKSDIEWVYLEGITTGCSSERYCPDGYVTREQMASFLARALKLTGSAPDAFTDDEASIHEPNINLVAKAGIATGCAPGKYCPTGLVSREQMASFLARALKLGGSAPDAFTDDETSIHEPNINLVAKAGVATGCGGGKYCPTANVTRGQMAAFLHRAFGP